VKFFLCAGMPWHANCHAGGMNYTAPLSVVSHAASQALATPPALPRASRRRLPAAAVWALPVGSPAAARRAEAAAGSAAATVSSVSASATQANQLLAALPPPQLQRWLPHLQWTELQRGQVLFEAGTTPSHAYFPTTAVVSLISQMRDGASAEVSVVGDEGMVGVSVFMGGGTSCNRAVAQTAGLGFRMPSRWLQDESERGGAGLRLLLRYTQALMAQTAQLVVCNRHHTIDQRLCRCLLGHLDRARADEIHLTHEWLSSMLGVRREGVTESAHRLQTAGVIRYGRGCITVLDRAALETRTCECYAAVKTEYDRLLPQRMAA
jgi:CRP-like cAMP-binding protein